MAKREVETQILSALALILILAGGAVLIWGIVFCLDTRHWSRIIYEQNRAGAFGQIRYSRGKVASWESTEGELKQEYWGSPWGYTYEVNGREYEASVWPSIDNRTYPGAIDEYIRYPKTLRITVLYNPANPKQAVIKRPFSYIWPRYSKMVYGGILFLTGLVLAVISLRSRAGGKSE